MKISICRTSGLALLLALLLFPIPALAQEDESGEDEDGWGKLIAEWGSWIAEPNGLGDSVATMSDPSNVFGTTLLGLSHGTETEDYARFGAELNGNRGRLLITWYAHDARAGLSMRDPGNFIFGEILATPVYAGYANDGFADAFAAGSTTGLRDQRIDYSRIAFSNSRVEARWLVGYRAVRYYSNLDAEYYSLVPDLPAFVPPLVNALPNLTPLPESAQLTSAFDGRGLTGGMEFEVPLWRDRLVVEAAVSLSVLSGSIDTSYRSETHFYTLGGNVLDAPYSEFGDFTVDNSGLVPIVTGTATAISQDSFQIGLQGESSRNSQIFEVSWGGRYKALSFMDIFVGWRTIHYADVAIDTRPRNVVVIGNTINTSDVTETDRSATYEGFYGGVGFRF